MTSIYDPKDPAYLDEADVRAELSRVFEICHGCQQCVTLCTSFPTLFEMIDRREDQDPGRMTPADQDQVVDECFHCGRCAIDCPFTPALGTPSLDERNVDFPRLMLRADAMQFDTGIKSVRARSATRLLGRTDQVGRFATRTSPIANRVVGAKPGSLVRRVVQAVTGVSAARLLPPFAEQRFSAWFAHRPTVTIPEPQGRVTLFATCAVEYQEPGIGRDLVEVYERNSVECTLSGARCCGAPLLYGGDIARFGQVAERNVRTLGAEVRRGTAVVVPQPTCRHILQHDYVDHVGGPDAELVAAHTFDAAEYLLGLYDGADTVFDTDFTGEIVARITYHVADHRQALAGGEPGQRLLDLTGATVTPVEACAGVDGMWGWRRGNDRVAIPLAAALGEQIEVANGDVVAGDCHFANTVILEQTGRVPRHPLQVLARAYGIDPGERAGR